MDGRGRGRESAVRRCELGRWNFLDRSVFRWNLGARAPKKLGVDDRRGRGGRGLFVRAQNSALDDCTQLRKTRSFAFFFNREVSAEGEKFGIGFW